MNYKKLVTVSCPDVFQMYMDNCPPSRIFDDVLRDQDTWEDEATEGSITGCIMNMADHIRVLKEDLKEEQSEKNN